MINPGVVAAIRVVGVRGDLRGAIRWTHTVLNVKSACVGIYQLLN